LKASPAFVAFFVINALLGFAACAFAAKAEITKEKLQSYYKSVVSISSKVPIEARTAKSLGIERIGNGVIIDGKHILTIGYLVIESSEIQIGFAGGRTLPGKLVGYDHNSGFGIIKPILPISLTPLQMGDSDQIELDDPLFILPSPQQGVGSKVKMVSRRSFVGWWEYYLEKPIYTFPVNQSWAGAPLLSLNGKILGIGSLFVVDSTSRGVLSPGNMFVPINLLKPILNDLKTFGRRKSDIKPFLGVSSEDSSGKIIVTRVSQGGPSYKAGLKPKDIIKTVNGVLVSGLKEFYKKVWSSSDVGSIITLGIDREGVNLIISVKSGDRMDHFVKPKSF